MDVIICGSGPAGIQAALYIKRANLDVMVIGKDGGSLSRTDKVANYFGVPTMSGPELLAIGHQQLKDLNIPLIQEEITGLHMELEGFSIITDKNTYTSKSVILATGSPRMTTKLKGVKEFEGKGVSYCAICDAFFHRNKNVAVLGHGEYAAHEAAELVNVAKQVTVYTNGLQATGHFDPRVIMNTAKLKSVKGSEKVESIELEDGTLEQVSGIFVAFGSASSVDLAVTLGVEVSGNKIVVSDSMETNVPGLFAAGDCTPGLMQISKAVGDGCVAGLQAITYLRKLG
jgi:thioredoxin reductase (NADPH)